MIARALLILAVFAGLLGAQLEARGLGAGNRTPICGDCCAVKSEASCCQSEDRPTAPVSTPTANSVPDWKIVMHPVLVFLPAFVARELPRISVSLVGPRVSGLACIERTCVRLI